MNDELMLLMQELVRSDSLGKTHIGLDFFDATINRIGAYAVGSRSALKGLLSALLEPKDLLCKYDGEGNYFARLGLAGRMQDTSPRHGLGRVLPQKRNGSGQGFDKGGYGL